MLRIDNSSTIYTPGPQVVDEDTKPQSTSHVASANGIKGKAVEGFLDAAQKDRPNDRYIQMFFNQSQFANSPAPPSPRR